MPVQDFNQFADLPALEAEKAKVLSIFDEIQAGILNLGKLGFKIDSSKGIAEITKIQKEVDALENKLVENNLKLQVAEQKLMDLRTQSALKQQQEELKLEKIRADAEKAQETRDIARMRRIKAEETEREKLAAATGKTGGAEATDYTRSIPFTTNVDMQTGAIREPAVDIAALRGEKDLLTDVERQAALTSNSLTAMGESNLRAADRMTLADKQILEGEAKVAAGAEASAAKTNAFGNMLTNVGQRISTFVVRDLLRAAAGFLVFTLAFEGIKLLFEFIVSQFSKVDEAAARLDLLNKTMAEASKDASNELTDLKLLRMEAQNVNDSMEKRLAAVKRLKDEFPDTYKNMKDEIILLGQDKIAYENLAAAIILAAKAQAARVQIEDLERQRLDVAFQKQKINNAVNAENARAADTQSSTVAVGGGIGSAVTITKEEEIRANESRRKKALDAEDKKDATLNEREMFLIKTAGLDNIAKTVEKDEKDQTKVVKDETDKRLAEAYKYATESEKLVLQQQANEYKAIAEGGGLATNLRIDSRKKELAAEIQINSIERQNELYQADQTAKEQLARVGISNKEKLATEEKHQEQRNEIIKKYRLQADALEASAAVDIIKIRADVNAELVKEAEEAEKMIEEQLAKELKAREDYAAKMYAQASNRNATDTSIAQGALDKEFAERLKHLSTDEDEYVKAQQEFEVRSQEIQFNSKKKQLQIDIDYYKGRLRELQANGLDTSEVEKTIAEKEAEAQKLVYDKEKLATDERLKALKSLQSAYDQLRTAMLNAFSSGISGIFERRKNELQDQIDLVNTLRDAEIKRIQDSGDTQINQAARIAIVENKAQNDREALQRRQQQAARQQAIFERTFKVFQIVTDTITQVNKIKLEALAAIDPAAKLLLTSEIPIAIATGAANLVALLATPIPKYAKGIESSPAGPALVGEAGRELAVDPSGNLTLYNRATIANLKKGTRIHSNPATEAILKASEQERFGLVRMLSNHTAPQGDDRVVDELKKLNKKSGISIYNHPAIETTAWYKQQMKY